MEKNKKKIWFVNISEYHHRTIMKAVLMLVFTLVIDCLSFFLFSFLNPKIPGGRGQSPHSNEGIARWRGDKLRFRFRTHWCCSSYRVIDSDAKGFTRALKWVQHKQHVPIICPNLWGELLSGWVIKGGALYVVVFCPRTCPKTFLQCFAL